MIVHDLARMQHDLERLSADVERLMGVWLQPQPAIKPRRWCPACKAWQPYDAVTWRSDAAHGSGYICGDCVAHG